ncbi:MAG: fibronectin type III domain-containing protein, partial [Deltaproteobacteria bacterium]|nr:fibronectin type III domain-containing protein [Deltaproteobacteria bacterium]
MRSERTLGGLVALCVAACAGAPKLEAPSVPSAPRNVSAQAGPASAVVTWSLPASDGRSAITGFVVAWSEGGGGELELDDAAAAEVAVQQLRDGTSYTFTVRARNAIGLGPASEPSAPVTPADLPDAPVIASATAGIRSVQLRWTAPDAHGAPITAWHVTQSHEGGAFATSIIGASDDTGATVVGLLNGGTYAFAVSAQNAVGTGPSSAPSETLTLVDLPGTPGAPSGQGAVRSARLSWTAPLHDGGSPLLGY